MSTTNPPQTLPAALAALDDMMAANAALRAKIADVKAELDNTYVLMRTACEQAARLAVEMEHSYHEREQLRDSLEATTGLVADLTAERSELRQRCEELTVDRDTWRASSASVDLGQQ